MTNDAQLSITELPETLQHNAVKTFATFYQQLFDANNLELMSNFDVVTYMTDINDHMVLSRFMTKAQRLADSINFSYQDYVNLIARLDQAYFETGNPAQPWATWYANHFSQLATA
ncbi:hypothetical protein [Lactiplantibacillus mudanjiangensis]|uniref:Uncharacterized protein n=1 Tax=Lactiplantibacillus mudanjiangensis TaxID=1296538 RepID=A0A660E1F3_9LACO|nr:hypothetical protein [Lactiplantibacillus mudanjiangensis]VDG25119.1 hypothetical protein [Lactobacillus sp. CBA3605] [Lactiplantibacillus mudanjiangensis]VDG29472.1 hypothetical protein [Lactobacillus sp. CBA3605] [Lactiplantibacillus mudanjiangensis]VDG32585.1 hypothetical protein [Lactobacillus sp. CBA3605] [Lactiplantibacillus mudanjiangensis]